MNAPADWYGRAAAAPRLIETPRPQPPGIIISDTTASVSPGVQASGYSVQLVGSNSRRVYLLIQNNCASTNIALAVGNGASASGLVIVPGGYYERQIYCFTQAVFVTFLAATTATDYITYEEGSSTQS